MARFLLGLIACVLTLPAPAQVIAGTYRQNDLSGLRGAVEKNPDNAGLRLRLSQALLRHDEETAHPDRAKARLDEAREQFRRVLDLNPKSVIPLRVMTMDSYRSRKLDEAIVMGNRLLAVAPSDSEITRTVLKALLRLRKIEDAAALCVSWLKGGHTPSFGAVQGFLSTLLLNKPFRNALGPKLEAAVKAAPQDVTLRLFLAIFYIESGRTESAWRAVHEAEALGLCETRSGSRHAFCRILASRSPEFESVPGTFDGADPEALARHRANHTKHAGLAMRHARLLDLGGRGDDAIATYAEVRKLNPGYWPAFYRSGQLLLEAGRPEDAAPLLDRARTLFPSSLPIRLAAADAWTQSGDSARAISLISEVAPHHDPGERSRELLKLLGGRNGLDSLVKSLRAHIAKDPSNPYPKAWLALALHGGSKVTEARKVALSAERAGLTGADGYPSSVLYDVFGEEKPAGTGGGK
ncbi:MAG: hypothetical protein CMJ83_05555 [Planctomycetes bacterium]|nr:hypothetical protein [Planctomycetota bacterium]